MRQQIDIPERERSMMLQMLGLKQDQQIPDSVNDTYWKIKQIADSVSHYFTDADLMWILVASGMMGSIPAKPARTVVDLFNDGILKAGERVTCKWRGQTGKEAMLQGVSSSGKALVRFIGKAETYEVNAIDVAIPVGE
jgi:hypothetical protein